MTDYNRQLFQLVYSYKICIWLTDTDLPCIDIDVLFAEGITIDYLLLLVCVLLSRISFTCSKSAPKMVSFARSMTRKLNTGASRDPIKNSIINTNSYYTYDNNISKKKHVFFPPLPILAVTRCLTIVSSLPTQIIDSAMTAAFHQSSVPVHNNKLHPVHK